VNQQTIARLSALTADFYARLGDDFGETRPRLNPGVQRVLGQIASGAVVVEAGCGDAKVGRRLTDRVPRARYLGLDASAVFLERALRLTLSASAAGRTAALLEPAGLAAWPDTGPDLALARVDLLAPDVVLVRPGLADWALAFAVLHHIPGLSQRQTVVRRWADWLKPGGRLAFSCWQPQRSPRWGRLVRPWSEAGLAESDVDPGDHLLGWERRELSGLRYVHVCDPAEVDGLLAGVGLVVVDRYTADGHSGEMADYVVARKTP